MAARQSTKNILRSIPSTSHIDGSTRAVRKGQIYVSKLHWSISRGILHTYFQRFGKVDSVFIPYDIRTGLSKGFGYVFMRSEEEVKVALEQRNQIIGQFNILVSPRIKNTVTKEDESTTVTGTQESSVDPPDTDTHTKDSQTDSSSVEESSVEESVQI